MGHFHDDYEHASADLVDYYSQPILYSDPTLSTPAEHDAAVYAERAERRKNDHGWYWAKTRRVVLIVDVATSIRPDGVVTVDDVEYRIEMIGDRAGDRIEIGLVRVEATEVSRPSYRGFR